LGYFNTVSYRERVGVRDTRNLLRVKIPSEFASLVSSRARKRL